MAAPANTARTTPVGIPYHDPFPTTIAFSLDPDISFWEKEVTPPGLDGGDAINTTTMHNTTYRTMRSRSLITVTEFTLVAAYDERVYDQIIAIINDDTGSVSVWFPDGASLDFWGYLRVFAPATNSEGGDQPTATITITPTNWDTTNAVEAAPVLTSVAGT